MKKDRANTSVTENSEAVEETELLQSDGDEPPHRTILREAFKEAVSEATAIFLIEKDKDKPN